MGVPVLPLSAAEHAVLGALVQRNVALGFDELLDLDFLPAHVPDAVDAVDDLVVVVLRVVEVKFLHSVKNECLLRRDVEACRLQVQNSGRAVLRGSALDGGLVRNDLIAAG